MSPGDFAMGPIGGGEKFLRGLTPSDRIAHGPKRKWRGGAAKPLWESAALETCRESVISHPENDLAYRKHWFSSQS